MKKQRAEHFERQYQTHLKHLRLKGLQPKTIEACSRAVLAANFVGPKAGFGRCDRQSLGLGNVVQVIDGRVARIARHNAATLASCCKGQIAKAAPVVEDCAAKIRQRLLLKRIESQIRLAHLALTLHIEEADAGIRTHGVNVPRSLPSAA